MTATLTKVNNVNFESSTPAPGTVLVTGATAGLGSRVVERLAARSDTEVIVGGRSVASVDGAIEAAHARTGSGKTTRSLPQFVADLGDLTQVDRAIDALADAPLRGIVANAGLTLGTKAVSAQGHELTFAVNVLAHQRIFDRLASSVVDGGRIVIVASGVHDPDNKLARRAGVPVPEWIDVATTADPTTAVEDPRGRYSNSKFANILQAQSLQQRLRAEGRQIDVFAIDPGLMVDTDFARSYPAPLRVAFRAIGRAATPMFAGMRLSTTSARHIERLLHDESLAGEGFAYFDGDRRTPPAPEARRADFVEAFGPDIADLLARTIAR
ncbi:MAG: SDR family NAD(P)-dependent oxidoreductase [Actinomycetota bacterium]